MVLELRQPSMRESGGDYEPISTVVARNADRFGNIFLKPRIGDNLFSVGRSSVREFEATAAKSASDDNSDNATAKEENALLSITPVAKNEGHESIFYLDVYTSAPSTLVACSDEDLPRDPTTNELLKGPVVHFSDSNTFVLAKNQDAYQVSRAPKCAHCGKAVTSAGGKFSGSYYPASDGTGKVHSECWEAYQLLQAPKCVVCAQAVTAAGGKFSGTFYSVDEGSGKVHEECWDAYQISKAPPCVLCGKGITSAGGHFSGSYYPAREGTGKVHEECWETYKRKG